MQFNTEGQRAKLLKAIEGSKRALRPFRDVRKKFIRDYAGSYYGSGSDMTSEREIVSNLMYQAAETYTMTLAANRPRILVTSKYPELTWFSYQFQQATNNLIEEIHLEETLRAAVLEAFFTLGVVKVYTGDAGLVELKGEDEWLDPGKPFAENISFDDFIYDTSAPTWSKKRFALNKYRMGVDKFRSEPSFNKKVVNKVLESYDYKSQHDDEGERPIRNMNTNSDGDEFRPSIQLMDIWLPSENKVVTMCSTRNAEPLRVVDWDGPEHGPFHILNLAAEVPDQILGVSPAMNLKPLFDIVNGLLRKQKRQAQRQKDIPFYQAGSHDDARRLQRADDGEWVQVNNPESVNVLKMGGVDQGNMSFSYAMQELFDRMAGNLQAMAGLGPSADTATQDKLIHGAISKREANMQYRVVSFTEQICSDLGRLLWNDPFKEMPEQREIESYKFDVSWTPENREGDFLQYNFHVEPFSMMYKSPSERMSSINQFVQQMIIPLMPNIQEAGGQFDAQELIELYAELMDAPRIKNIVKFEKPKEDRAPANPAEPAQPPRPNVTVRENIRRSVPTGGTAGARANVMQQVLSGSQPTPQQVNMMGRQPAT
ncbi:hypothetical protein [Acinetobacter sp.]|uniref:hypothetical protein n=1 Tax=Acinetobacter sp. TaxID=472 RepID=UPI000C0B9D10|nr:hypothetical protein [Acinetobacter sp.]MAK31506.1 hypothetical protein [Acinetobacter sp.]|tara:strand:- start:2663 stop:4456 length:1794 start_codon:yes stop_codon:yes gene_type:complete